jgi:6-phosphogluconolactonase
MTDAEIIILENAEQVAHQAAQRIARLVQEATTRRERFSLVLSGGSTPHELYKLLAEEPYRGQIPWSQVHLFWADERCVSAEDPDSNYRLAHEAFIDHVPIPPDNVHRARGELEPERASRSYEQVLQDFFCGPQSRFDLVLLGLGDDGHTASLFPHSSVLYEKRRLVVAVQAHYEDRPTQRLTLTLPAINSARQVFFLVTGQAKAEIVRAVLEGPPGSLPAQQIQPTAGQLTWLLDKAAANLLAPKGQ